LAKFSDLRAADHRRAGTCSCDGSTYLGPSQAHAARTSSQRPCRYQSWRKLILAVYDSPISVSSSGPISR
jgi:hypothetical protein